MVQDSTVKTQLIR